MFLGSNDDADALVVHLIFLIVHVVSPEDQRHLQTPNTYLSP